MAEQPAAQIHPVPAPEPARRTLTALERLETGIRAMKALEPVFANISDHDRQEILSWLAEQYPRPVRPGAKPGRKPGKGA